MGDSFPEPFANAGGDEVTTAPVKGDRSLLAAERGTQQTRRLETDADSNLFVNVAAGTIVATIGEVEIKNDVGNPVPVSDGGGSLTVDGTVAVSNLPVVQPVSDNGGSLTVDGTVAVSNFPASVEVSNDSGNPLPVSGTVTANAGTGPFPVSDNGGSLTVDGSVSVSNFPATQNVAITSSVEVEVKNDTGNPVPVSGTVTANAGSGPFPVSDNGGSLTVDGTVAVSNFPAVQSVNDNGGSLTVDGTVAVTFPSSGSATESNVSGSASNVTLLAANASRKMTMIYNDSTSDLYVKLGATASTSSFTVKLVANAYYELPLPVYTGIIDGIWTVAVGSARMTEY